MGAEEVKGGNTIATTVGAIVLTVSVVFELSSELVPLLDCSLCCTWLRLCRSLSDSISPGIVPIPRAVPDSTPALLPHSCFADCTPCKRSPNDFVRPLNAVSTLPRPAPLKRTFMWLVSSPWKPFLCALSILTVTGGPWSF